MCPPRISAETLTILPSVLWISPAHIPTHPPQPKCLNYILNRHANHSVRNLSIPSSAIIKLSEATFLETFTALLNKFKYWFNTWLHRTQSLRSAFFRDFPQRKVVIRYGRCGTIYRFPLQSSCSCLKMGQIGYPETAVTNYEYRLCKIWEEQRLHLHRGSSLKSRTIFLQKLVFLNRKKFSPFYGKNVHYRVNNRPPIVPNLIEMNPVHTLSHTTCLISHSALSPHLRLNVQSSIFHTKILSVFIFSLILAICTTLTVLVDLTTLTLFHDESKLLRQTFKHFSKFKFYVVRTVHFGMKLYNEKRNWQVFNFFYLFTYALHDFV
jgi:hypothetical protein